MPKLTHALFAMRNSTTSWNPLALGCSGCSDDAGAGGNAGDSSGAEDARGIDDSNSAGDSSGSVYASGAVDDSGGILDRTDNACIGSDASEIEMYDFDQCLVEASGTLVWSGRNK